MRTPERNEPTTETRQGYFGGRLEHSSNEPAIAERLSYDVQSCYPNALKGVQS